MICPKCDKEMKLIDLWSPNICICTYWKCNDCNYRSESVDL